MRLWPVLKALLPLKLQLMRLTQLELVEDVPRKRATRILGGTSPYHDTIFSLGKPAACDDEKLTNLKFGIVHDAAAVAAKDTKWTPKTEIVPVRICLLSISTLRV